MGEMARRLKKDARAVRRAYDRAERKIPHEGEIAPAREGSLEGNDPELYAEFVTQVVNTDGKTRNVEAIAENLGISPKTADHIARKLNTTQIQTKDAIRNVKRDYLKRRWGSLRRTPSMPSRRRSSRRPA